MRHPILGDDSQVALAAGAVVVLVTLVAYRRYRELGQEIAQANARRVGLGKKRGGRR
jgi:hypothetical protein